MTPPTCRQCGSPMRLLPHEDRRDRLDQSGLCYWPAESFECLTESCAARCIVTTVRIIGSKEVYPQSTPAEPAEGDASC